MTFYPGPGLGGHCIPLDPFYLSWKLKTLNYTARFIELAGEVNSSMPQYVVGMAADALNDAGLAVRGARILLLGVAYKPNVGDLRESPALDILRLLQHKGACLFYHDPYVPSLGRGKTHATQGASSVMICWPAWIACSSLRRMPATTGRALSRAHG